MLITGSLLYFRLDFSCKATKQKCFQNGSYRYTSGLRFSVLAHTCNLKPFSSVKLPIFQVWKPQRLISFLKSVVHIQKQWFLFKNTFSESELHFLSLVNFRFCEKKMSLCGFRTQIIINAGSLPHIKMFYH